MIRRFPFSHTGCALTPGQTCARFVLLAFAGCLMLALSTATPGATLPAGFSETLVTNGLSSPTSMDFAPDGRLFVCLQGGQLRVIKNGSLLPTPFVSLTVNSAGERGLLGVAFDPNFATNNFVYVYYTATSPAIHNRVSRFTANGDVAVAGSELVLLDLENLGATNHNGGAIHFGPDGKLYVAVGENATPTNAQTLANRLGKMLRINSDGTIPTDNPFFNTASGDNRSIWALGLRNPFTFAFQPGTGRLFINDVGQDTWEEINDGIAGSNYGWNLSEGPTSNPAFRSPLFFYGHGTGPTVGCAIAGGTFYNPNTVRFPQSFVGKYFFADLCSNWIRAFDPTTGTASDFASGVSGPVDLKVSVDGSLYVLARNAGSVVRVQFTDPMLISESNSDLAIALDSVWLLRDPFSLTNPVANFSADQRTRISLFGMNMDLLPGEDSSAVTVRAEDAQSVIYPATVEFVGKVPGFDLFTQVVVKLPDSLPTGQSVLFSATLRGKTTNKVRVRMQ